MALIETREPPFRAQIQPVLRDHAATLSPPSQRRVIERLRIDILRGRRPVPDSVLAAIGLERVTGYRRVKSAA
jgi:hypothetical protein